MRRGCMSLQVDSDESATTTPVSAHLLIMMNFHLIMRNACNLQTAACFFIFRPTGCALFRLFAKVANGRNLLCEVGDAYKK